MNGLACPRGTGVCLPAGRGTSPADTLTGRLTMKDFTKLFGAGVITLALAVTGAVAQDKVSYGTNWLAQAEHGGFYQAVADGTYAKYGLDVTIRQGGPQAANRSLLVGGQI